MKLHLTTTAIALGLAALSTPALAQDARDTHFDGPYISGFAGMGVQRNDNGDGFEFDTNNDGTYNDTVRTAAGANAFSTGFCNGYALTPSRSDGCAGDHDGLEYGGRIGFDKRMGGGNFVLGGLVEFNKSNSKDSVSAFSTTPARYTIVRKLDYAVSARARAGYTPGGGALFYVTGGATYAKINHRFITSNAVNAFDEQRDGKMSLGWQAGGGTEIMVTNNVSLGLEYLYNQYKDNKYRVAVTQGTAAATNPFLQAGPQTNLRSTAGKYDLHSLRATVSYQF